VHDGRHLDAIPSIFSSLHKVAILHALFMWTTLQVFGITDYAVTLSLLSAVFGVIPIIPSPLLALPPAVELWSVVCTPSPPYPIPAGDGAMPHFKSVV
jgi:hypothetical protein